MNQFQCAKSSLQILALGIALAPFALAQSEDYLREDGVRIAGGISIDIVTFPDGTLRR